MKLFVAVPAYDCKVHVGTAQALAVEAAVCQQLNVGIRLAFQPGMALVHAARNLLCDDFLNSDCSHLVFVDADCGFEPGATLRLTQHAVDIVAGACRRRREPEDYAIKWLKRGELSNGLIEVEAIGMAFACISRASLEHFREATPERAYVADGGRKVHGFFDSPIQDGALWGEDMAFCKIMRQIGRKVCVDPSLTLTHYDSLNAFTGNVGRWLGRVEGHA